MIAAAVTAAVLMPGVGLAAGATQSPRTDVPQLPKVATGSSQHRAVPKKNIAPQPNFYDVCATNGYNDSTCIREALAAIKHARSGEHMKRRTMVLPRNFVKLTVAEQTFVITNLERVDRGMRPFQGMSSVLDRVAKGAAALRVDATLVTSLVSALHIAAYGANWASDYGPLSADYNWMYNDGYSRHHGINVACPKPGAAGCWGHRRNILWPYTQPRLIAGTGTARPAGTSIAEVLSGASGSAPKFDYTWKQALRHGANGHHRK